MKKPNIPENEKERLIALDEYQILDTLQENEFDNITRIASQICETPISLISLVDKDRQWFKSHYGIDTTETPRDVAFCAHAINNKDEIMIVPDSRKDDRFFDNPLVTSKPWVVFYAGVPLVSPGGHALGTLCVVDQIPHQLREDQLQSLKALSDQVINLFELRKANIKLEKNQKHLETRNKELEQFAYVVSHDIKSPLANIISFTELFKEQYSRDMDETGITYIDYIQQSSFKLKALVDGILSYYRGDQLLPTRLEDVFLPAFFQSIVELLQLPVQDLHITYPKEACSVRVNKTAIEQIFMNLITNAIKYNNKEKILIDITFRQDENFYYFTVTDNGIGIKPESRDKIFELFKILDTRDRFGDYGTGIGLATVKKLVQNNGGSITVQSVINEKTVFWFSIKRFN
jgi:signal transduction histidine kinase